MYLCTSCLNLHYIARLLISYTNSLCRIFDRNLCIYVVLIYIFSKFLFSDLVIHSYDLSDFHCFVNVTFPCALVPLCLYLQVVAFPLIHNYLYFEYVCVLQFLITSNFSSSISLFFISLFYLFFSLLGPQEIIINSLFYYFIIEPHHYQHQLLETYKNALRGWLLSK